MDANLLTPDELDAHDVDELIANVVGVWPDGWSEEHARRFIAAGANMVIRQRRSLAVELRPVYPAWRWQCRQCTATNVEIDIVHGSHRPPRMVRCKKCNWKCSAVHEPAYRYWIDRDGKLWKGPVAPDDTLHYAVFEGFMTVEPFSPIWVARRSAEPENAVELI